MKDSSIELGPAHVRIHELAFKLLFPFMTATRGCTGTSGRLQPKSSTAMVVPKGNRPGAAVVGPIRVHG